MKSRKRAQCMPVVPAMIPFVCWRGRSASRAPTPGGERESARPSPTSRALHDLEPALNNYGYLAVAGLVLIAIGHFGGRRQCLRAQGERSGGEQHRVDRVHDIRTKQPQRLAESWPG